MYQEFENDISPLICNSISGDKFQSNNAVEKDLWIFNSVIY